MALRVVSKMLDTLVTPLLSRNDTFKRRIDRYEDEYRSIRGWCAVTLLIFLTCAACYIFPELMFWGDFGFIPASRAFTEKSWQIAATVTGVVFGAYVQQLLHFLVTPRSDALSSLQAEVLLKEFVRLLEDFREKLQRDDENYLDDEKVRVDILLSSPVLLMFEELKAERGPGLGESERTRFEKAVVHIFASDKKFSRRIICLDKSPQRHVGFSALGRFLKVFAGWAASDWAASQGRAEGHAGGLASKKRDEFYRCYRRTRQRLVRRAWSFCDHPAIKPHLQFSSADDINWQAIAVLGGATKFNRAVVGFYGEEYFRRTSALGLMSSMLEEDSAVVPNRGFFSTELDVVSWVSAALIEPYAKEDRVAGEAEELEQGRGIHHSVSVIERTLNQLPTGTLTRAERVHSVHIEDGRCLKGLDLKLTSDSQNMFTDIEYPRFDGSCGKRVLLYCRHLYHPLLAESSLWSSQNIRLVGTEARVLDMCCGIGVQGISALDRGAKEIHAVDSDPLALLCAGENLRRRLEEFDDHADKPKVSLTLCDGFQHVKAKSQEEWKGKLERLMREDFWQEKGGRFLGGVEEVWQRNESFIERAYVDRVPNNAFDVVLLEPPFVEFLPELAAFKAVPHHLLGGFVDEDFRLTRSLLLEAHAYLKDWDRADYRWVRPCAQQSFSSLENVAEFELFVERTAQWDIFRRSSLRLNGIYWHFYHLVPRLRIGLLPEASSEVSGKQDRTEPSQPSSVQ